MRLNALDSTSSNMMKMKKQFLTMNGRGTIGGLVIACLFLLQPSLRAGSYQNPLIQGNLADPCVILHEGVYYLYATGGVDGDNGTRVYTSTNLVDWERGPVVFRPGKPHVWAPDVWRDPDTGRFYLYFTVNETVGVAEGDGPLGPFEVRRTFFERAIDAHLFRDDDGKLYLYYVQFPGFRISVQAMSGPTEPEGEPKELLQPESDWERRAGHVTEGPWLIKHDGTYYMLYSGSGADTPDYAVGYATASSPMGPFTRAEHNPIVHRSDKIFGPGHGCAIQDSAGEWWHIYHQKTNDRVEWRRFIAMDRLWFDANGGLHGRATRETSEPAPAVSASISPTALSCEYLTEPLGIDVGQPRLSWQLIPGAGADARGLGQSRYRILVAGSAATLAENRGDLWESGWVDSDQNLHVRYAGKPLASRQECFWKVQVADRAGGVSDWSAPARWSMGLLSEADWAAKWITAEVSEALPLMRTTFRVEKPVRRAELAICGLGFFEASLNGERIGDAVLEPGWTDYRKRALYRVDDLTEGLVEGENVLGVMLGNGMYNVTGGRYVKFTGSFGPPKLIAQLDIEYADGTSARIVTDDDWRVAPGPIRFSCIFGGEDYDARAELPGWDRPGFDAGGWGAAVECEGPGGVLTTRSGPAVVVRERFETVAVTEPRPGVWVYDLGRNFSGWPKIRLKGPAGATVKLITGELLDAEGLVTQRSSGGPVWFSYTLKGQGIEEWAPRFSYTGFRYVQVEGGVPADSAAGADDDAVRIEGMEGQFLYPDAAVAGEFACSNPDVNRVHALILSAIKSNFKSVLTDCPHREKLGWLECTHLLAGCFMYNFDSSRFYEKIARDMREAQLEDGLVPDIAPEYVVFAGGFRDSPEWGSGAVIAPWRSYWMYGDPTILQEQYATMKRYVGYLGGKAEGHIVSYGLGDWCDIGPASPGVSQLTSLGLTATGVYYQDIDTVRRVAELLGHPAEAAEYAALGQAVAGAFNREFFHPDQGSYDRNSQTGNAMPLVLGLVAPEARPVVLESLAKIIEAGGNRVTAGDIGFYYVVQALLEGGRSDLLYEMLCQEEGPGYLYQLAKGATSLTEAWDTNPALSQNHCMLGHIEEWFYSGLLGIRAAAPGFREIQLVPQVVGDLTSANGHYDSMYGRIASAWQRNGDRVTFEFTVPVNTKATVHIPARSPQDVMESGVPVARAEGVTPLRNSPGTAVFEIGSGSYRFESRMP